VEISAPKGDVTHLPSLSECMPMDTTKRDSVVVDLRNCTQYHVLRFLMKPKKSMNVFYPFQCAYQQCSWRYANGNNWYAMQQWPIRKNAITLGPFYSKYNDTHFSNNSLTRPKTVSLFGTTYFREQLFSKTKNVISKTRTRIISTHLENSLQSATAQIKADIDRLTTYKDCQILTTNKHFLDRKYVIFINWTYITPCWRNCCILFLLIFLLE
jgi:hypothetical protein